MVSHTHILYIKLQPMEKMHDSKELAITRLIKGVRDVAKAVRKGTHSCKLKVVAVRKSPGR